MPTTAIWHPQFLPRYLPRPLVMTNGVFDILHVGHVECLRRASRLGNCLVVAVNSDESARGLGKGPGRPINRMADRLEMLAELHCVDGVTWFDDDTPLALINTLRPDVLVKGGDYTPEQITGAAEVTAWGGKVITIPFKHQTSTTALIERIRGAA